VTYGDKPIAALYFSGSDGKTRSGEVVWRSKRFPYLQAKKDPYGGRTLRGHGTGLSAQGAAGFAKNDGWNFRKILTYYYTGVKLERAY
jgi:peptidoglycan hydrolase-like amidase